jgi:hypothetical protein
MKYPTNVGDNMTEKGIITCPACETDSELGTNFCPYCGFNFIPDEIMHIIFLLDKSGSMGIVRDATISKFNDYIQEQKTVPGQAFMTLTLFDNEIYVKYKNRPIKDVPLLDRNNKDLNAPESYLPSGTTAYFDAIGITISELDKLEANQKTTVPFVPDTKKKVLFVILTDGQENSSQEYTDIREIQRLIDLRKEQFNWEFNFLGAGIDAKKAGNRLHIDDKFIRQVARKSDVGNLLMGMRHTHVSARLASTGVKVHWKSEDKIQKTC